MALITPSRQLFQRPTPTRRLPGGWQTGDPAAIARRYSPTAPALKSNLFQAAKTQSRLQPVMPPLTAGSAGPVGEDGPPAPTLLPEVVVSAPAENEGVQPPQGNATQRWSETKDNWIAQGGTSRSFNKAQVERGVRPRIDGRAAPDPKASTASADIRAGWGWDRNSKMDLPY